MPAFRVAEAKPGEDPPKGEPCLGFQGYNSRITGVDVAMTSMGRSLSVILLLGVLFGLASAPAHARSGLVILHGEDVFDVGMLPGEHRGYARETVGERARIGYRYKYCGFLWVNLWTWGGEWCVYSGDKFESISDERAAGLLKSPQGLLRPPLRYLLPGGPVLACFMAMILAMVAVWWAHRAPADDPASSSAEERSATVVGLQE